MNLTVVVKNGWAKASLTVILFSGSTTKHFLMRSLGSSVFFRCGRNETKPIDYTLKLRWKQKFEAKTWNMVLTWNVGPLWRCKTIFSFHNISQHHHLFSVPKWRATNKQCKHNNSAGPAKIKEEQILVYRSIGQIKFIKAGIAWWMKLTYQLLLNIRGIFPTCYTLTSREPNSRAYRINLQNNVFLVILSIFVGSKEKYFRFIYLRLTKQFLIIRQDFGETEIRNFYIKIII